MSKIAVHWFRRDLRLQDNSSLNRALRSGKPVLCLFIFDKDILDKLPANDSRVTFIHEQLQAIDRELGSLGSGLLVLHDSPIRAWQHVAEQFEVAEVHTNSDYEPYALSRDQAIREFLESEGVSFSRHKDHVIFEPGEILKDDGKPYTVYTPYKRKCLRALEDITIPDPEGMANGSFYQIKTSIPALADIGFTPGPYPVQPFETGKVKVYDELRDDPAGDHTTRLGPHLRFGTVSVREMALLGQQQNAVFLSELFWREFFIQILFQFPHVADANFNAKYDGIDWLNDERHFEKWCTGETGYPMVDAGMRQLNSTGFMHNRVRMVVASFLTKHLLTDWRLGEAYFAEKLLDYELASNNGNWQWAAGTGCDAAPYFRVFNPTTQLKKFDPDLKYVRKWVPEFDSLNYPQPIVDHKFARERAIQGYRDGIARYTG